MMPCAHVSNVWAVATAIDSSMMIPVVAVVNAITMASPARRIFIWHRRRFDHWRLNRTKRRVDGDHRRRINRRVDRMTLAYQCSTGSGQDYNDENDAEPRQILLALLVLLEFFIMLLMMRMAMLMMLAVMVMTVMMRHYASAVSWVLMVVMFASPACMSA